MPPCWLFRHTSKTCRWSSSKRGRQPAGGRQRGWRIPDVIEDGKDGLLVQPGDVSGLADAIARLLQNHPMREQMARNARQKYENRYSSHSVIPQIEAVYRELGMVPISSITR